MIPAAAPPRVQERLRDAADGPVPVVHRGDAAVYVDVAGWCVGVVAAGASRVPCALRISGQLPESFVREPGPAYLVGGTLHVAGRPLAIGRIEATYVPRLRRGVVPGNTARPVTVEVTPPTTVAGFVATHLPGRRIGPEAAARLVGRGEGLTPLGDDVLAGWLALHRAVGVPTPEVDAVVEGHAGRTTLLSATLLDCARHGEVLPEYAAWLSAIGTPDEPARVAALHRVGATSGAGLHQGALIALDQLQEAA